MRESKVAPKEFEIDEANRLLPLVSAIVFDLVKLQERLSFREERLAALGTDRELSQHQPYADELAQMREDVAADRHRLEACISELNDLGVVSDPLDATVVRFPSLREGAPCWLCWRQGDERIQFWSPNETDADWVPLELAPTEDNPPVC